MLARRLNRTDRMVAALDQAVRTVFGRHHSARPTPKPESGTATAPLTDAEQRRVVQMMRVNHSGEVCAQALYQAQAVTVRSTSVRHAMQEAAREENDHLSWCEHRLDALGGHTSYLNPFWYTGAFTIGLVAGLAGDRWNLAFLAETERQVVAHLEGHLTQLPAGDTESRAILLKMRDDEATHATTAVKSGAASMPGVLKRLMGLAALVMTTTAARL